MGRKCWSILQTSEMSSIRMMETRQYKVNKLGMESITVITLSELDYRQKRGRYGNKYADNKSYGFWISALNKAYNYKRGKRGEPFVPGLSAAQPPFNIVRALKGGGDADLKELVVDHDYTQEQN